MSPTGLAQTQTSSTSLACERRRSSSGTRTRPWRGPPGTGAGRSAAPRGEAGCPSPGLESLSVPACASWPCPPERRSGTWT